MTENSTQEQFKRLLERAEANQRANLKQLMTARGVNMTYKEIAKQFAKDNHLSEEAGRQLQSKLEEAWQAGYDACMMDDADPEMDDADVELLADHLKNEPKN
jgi:hypothetical protein